MSTINTSVTNLIKELETRIEMFSSIEVKGNLDTKSFNEITSIIAKYTDVAPQDIKKEDIIDFKISDIDELLHVMDITPTEINRVLVNFKRHAASMHGEKTKEAEDFFEDLKNKIVDYISNFISIDNAQNTFQNTKVQEYKRYIELFKSETIEEPFEDFEGLTKLMTSLALSNEDKWTILAYIANLNLSVAKGMTEEFNYASLIENMKESYYEENEELVKIIENKLSKETIDIELLPTYAQTIANETESNRMLVQNIIVAILASDIYSRYQTSTDEEEKSSLKELLDNTLNQQVNESCFVIETTKEILSKNKSLYENMHGDVMIYVDMTISEIVEEGYTREAAIDLKSLPILKTMTETIDKIETLETSDPDYQVCVGILQELNEAYESVMSKMNKELTRK